MDPEIINLILTFATEEVHGFNWRGVVYQAVNLTILLLILGYYLKEPLRNFLIERRGIIGNEIDEAQKAITEARKIHEEYDEKLKHIEEEIRNLIETIRKQGEIEKEDILKHAETASENMKEEAKETIQLETAKAKREIQQEAVSNAIELATSIIKQNLGESDKSKIIEEFIKKVDEEKWRRSQH